MLSVDLLTVFVASIVYLILEGVWYSPLLFGRLWLKLHGLTNRDLNKMRFGGSFIIAFVMAYFLALVEGYMDVTSFWDGVICGLILWVGFVVPTHLPAVFFARYDWKLFLIDCGYYLIGLIVIGGILAG